MIDRDAVSPTYHNIKQRNTPKRKDKPHYRYTVQAS